MMHLINLKLHCLVLVILLLIVSLNAQEIVAPKSDIDSGSVLSNGGCFIDDDTLYYFGGSFEKLESNTYNTNMYTLGLEAGVTVAAAPFKAGNDHMLKSQGFGFGYNANKSMLTVIGGTIPEDGRIVNKYDIEKGTWIDPNKSNEQIKQHLGDVVIDSGTLTMNSINTNYYYQYGGITKKDKNLAIEKPTLLIYDESKDEIEFVDNLGISKYHYLHDHSATFYQNHVYFIGGVQSDHKHFQPINEILVYDVKSKNMTIKYGSGSVPPNRRGHSATLALGHIYIVGGSTSLDKGKFETDHNIYRLNLKTFIWQNFTIPNFIPTYQGCLETYQSNILVYSFGFNQSRKGSIFQMISVGNENVAVPIFKNTVVEARNTRLTYELSYKATYLGTGIAAVVGLVLFLIMFFIFFRILQKTSPVLKQSANKKKLNEIIEPKPALFKFPSRSKESEILLETRLVEDDDNQMPSDRFSDSFIQFSEESNSNNVINVSDASRYS
ncbi:hypothetical protein K502DRAFT_325074 [Neoconidiobolus thromboides FSU 785]|nr:hypothetical protein K502DRAFT_325074 [Neoconidiobolus thromboides FSU 785]